MVVPFISSDYMVHPFIYIYIYNILSIWLQDSVPSEEEIQKLVSMGFDRVQSRFLIVLISVSFIFVISVATIRGKNIMAV